MFCALVVHGPDCEGWVVIDALDDVDVLLVDAKPVEGGKECLWVDFVKGLLPVQEKGVQGVSMSFCIFNEPSHNVDGL